MNLQPNPKSRHIEVQTDVPMETVKSHDPELLEYSSVFNIYGALVGHTHLLFNVTTPTGQVISSPPVAIQVFDALSLTPEYLILLPTATFQVAPYTLALLTRTCTSLIPHSSSLTPHPSLLTHH